MAHDGPVRDRMPGLEIPVCPRCAADNLPAATFCAGCGGPMSLIATTGPFETVLMQARAIREVAGARRPSGVVVAGAWLLGLACLVPVAAWVVSIAFHGGLRGGTAEGVLALLVPVAVAGIVGRVLWRVTSRYRASRRDPPGDADAPDSAG